MLTGHEKHLVCGISATDFPFFSYLLRFYVWQNINTASTKIKYFHGPKNPRLQSGNNFCIHGKKQESE